MGRICINEDDVAACPSEVGANRATNGTAAPDDDWIVCFNHDFIPKGERRLPRAKRRQPPSRARRSRWLRCRAAEHKRRGSAGDRPPRSGRHGKCHGTHDRQCGPRSALSDVAMPGARWTFSGRMDANMARSRWRGSVCPGRARRRHCPGPERPRRLCQLTVAARIFDVPRNSATNRVRGRSYTSSGGPICSTSPACMTATKSLMVSASS